MIFRDAATYFYASIVLYDLVAVYREHLGQFNTVGSVLLKNIYQQFSLINWRQYHQ